MSQNEEVKLEDISEEDFRTYLQIRKRLNYNVNRVKKKKAEEEGLPKIKYDFIDENYGVLKDKFEEVAKDVNSPEEGGLFSSIFSSN